MAITPDKLPQTDSEWLLFFKVIGWMLGFMVVIFVIVKTTVFITSLYNKLKAMAGINMESFVTMTVLEEFQSKCKLQQALDLEAGLKHLSEIVIAVDAKMDLLLRERGLLDGNNYQGVRKRKTDMSKRFSTNNE